MAEIEASLLAKVQSMESGHDQPVLVGFLRGRKKYIGVMVTCKFGQTLDDVVREVKKRGGKKIRMYHEIGTIYAELPVDKISGLTTLTSAERVYDAERTVTPCLYDSVPLSIGVERWKLPYILNGKRLTGKGIKVAVLDSGIDKRHPDFGWRIKKLKNFTRESLHKETSHGTHVAGIIGGSGKVSGYRFSGAAPQVSFYIAKVLTNSDNPKKIKVYGIFDAIRWAVKQKVHVINMSLGTSWCSDGTCPLCKMADYAVSQGITVVVSAGNNPPFPTISCPGNAKQVITVGASTKTPKIVVPSFSSRAHPHRSGKPDMVAPGVAIKAPQPGKGYGFKDGTSMAAPHVSGLAALFYQAARYLGKRKRPTPADIKQWLKQGCQPLGEHPGAEGSGLVNFHKTLELLQQNKTRSWFRRKRKKLQIAEHCDSVPELPAAASLALENQSTESPRTCPAALNVFCPHYNPETCDESYEDCIHYQTASQEKILREVHDILL